MASRAISRLGLALVLVAGWACGGDDLVLPEGPTSSLTLIRGDEQEGIPGEPLPEPLIVRLVDETGVGIPNRTVVWVASPGSGVINPATGMTDAEGFASAEWTLGTAEGLQRVTAQVPNIGNVTFTATNIDDGGGPEPAEPASVEAAAGDDQTAEAGSDVPIPPAVRVLDSEGAPVEGYEVTFAVTGGGGSVAGATQVTGADGIARVARWTLGATPGTNTLEARAGSLAGSPVVFTAEATAPDPGPDPGPDPDPEPDPDDIDRLIFVTPPRDAAANERFQVEVALVDDDGNVVPLSGIFIYVGLFRENEESPANDLLVGERFENTDDGVSTFELGVEQPGRYRLRALTDDLPELGPHGPEPWLYSQVFTIH